MEEKNRHIRDSRYGWIEFSVILIVYNLEHYLRKTVQSVLDQEFKNFELIIVDDGSTDGTLQVVEFFQDSRINVISQENGGASHARNTGMKAAKGKYVAFLDGDGYWYPDHLKMAYDFFRKHPGVYVYAARYTWNKEDCIPRRKGKPCSFVVRKLGLRGLLSIHTSSVVLNSSLASSLPLWEAGMKYGEDVLYWMRLMRRTAMIGLGKKVGSIYVQRAGSAMQEQACRYISVEDLLTRRLEEWKRFAEFPLEVQGGSGAVRAWLAMDGFSLSGVTAGLLCALLLLWPAYAGGTSYDVHENKFLTPLLLWLFDFLDRRCVWGIALFSVLTCMVKEDAPVYVAVIALWVVLRALTRTGAERRWGLLTGGAMLVGAVGYFLGVTAWLAADGDGVMSYRYSNFLYDGSDSLFTVIKAVLLSPVRTLRECFEGEKIAFFFLTMGPLLFLPLCTRRYERLVLLIPFLLVNLMSDYTYQHSIFFQYTYGSAACLFYLTAVNLAELPRVWNRPALAATAALLAGVCFCGNILPLSENYVNRYFDYRAVWQETDAVLDRIPDDASVTATTFLVVPLSRRAVLYDLRYCSQEHLLSTDYVVVETTDSGSLKPYAVDGEDGLEGLTALLRAAGYAQLPDTGSRLQLWKRP